MRKLVAKLGQETAALSAKSDGPKAGQVEALGQALSQAAEEAEATA